MPDKQQLFDSQYINAVEPDCAKPQCKLIGQDSNVFNLIGKASQCLKRAKQTTAAKEMSDRCLKAHSYDEVLCIIQEYVDII